MKGFSSIRDFLFFPLQLRCRREQDCDSTMSTAMDQMGHEDISDLNKVGSLTKLF